VGIQCWFWLGLVDDLLDQQRDIGEPSLEADCNCGRELLQRLVPIGKPWQWLSGDGRGLSFAGLIDQVDIDLPEEGHSVAVFDRREFFAVHPTSDGGFLDAAALGRLVDRDKAGQLIVGLIKVTLTVDKLRLDL
jgi:hypothetical protein